MTKHRSSTAQTVLPGLAHAPHNGARAVLAGPYEIFAGGTMDMRKAEDFQRPDTILVPLTSLNLPFGGKYEVISAVLVDYGGVPDNWGYFLESVIIPELQLGRRLLAFCAGSHGRTGTFLASLIALLESSEETPDPIAAVRDRHCRCAVETLAQAEAIFALRKTELPVRYRRAFAK